MNSAAARIPVATSFQILRPGLPAEDRAVALDRMPDFKALNRIIKPILQGDLERVAVLADFCGGSNFQPLDMFVDDCGALKGLPRNDEATTIYRRAAMLRMPMRDPEQLPAIYGTAILFSRRVWF